MQTKAVHHDHAHMRMDMSGTPGGDVDCTECPLGFGKTAIHRTDCSNSDQVMNVTKDAIAVSAETFASQLNLPQSRQPFEILDEFEQSTESANPRLLESARPLTVPLLV